MSLVEALISGIVQGLTEFLPVSSSGHLVLVHKFFRLTESSIFFDICLHVATLMAVVVYFKKDIFAIFRGKKPGWLLYIIIGTVPVAVAALLFEKQILAVFLSPKGVALMLMVTGVVLFAGQIGQVKNLNSIKGPTILTSILIGVGQAFALLPGISRSGMTISTGLLRGMSTEDAFKFSFLLSIPAILGALIYKALKIDFGAVVLSNLPGYIVGMTAAFLVGLLSLTLLRRVIKFRRLFIFGIYCLILGLAGMIFWE